MEFKQRGDQLPEESRHPFIEGRDTAMQRARKFLGEDPAATKQPREGESVAADDNGEHESELAASVPEGFHIDDEAKASWAVRKIVEAQAYGRRVQEWSALELRRAEREEQWLLRRFGPELEAWLRAQLQRQGGRRRSVALPGGTVGLRKQPPRLEVQDELALIAWCRKHLSEALRVIVQAEGWVAAELSRWHRKHAEQAHLKEQVLREPLKQHVAETGELPDGAGMVPARDQLYVK